MDFERIMAALPPAGRRKRLAVAAAEDAYVLAAVAEAVRRDLVTPVYCGNKEKIAGIAQEIGLFPAEMTIRPTADETESAALAVQLVRQGEADMLMKGLMQTSTLLRAVLDKENGLRGQKVLSHVSILHSPILNRRLILTDAAMVTYPDVETKAALIRNAVTAAQGLGIRQPKVAALAAIETVNPQMQATVDAAMLVAMNRRGQIRDCIVDGPLAMDLALSAEAAAHKGIASEVAGQADILLAHDIEAGNSILKTFIIAGGCLFGGIVMGASVPMVVTSRSDSEQSKLYSIACAAAMA